MSEVFRYRSFAADPENAVLSCHYELDGREFTERVTLPGQEGNPRWHTEAAQAAARLIFLLAGVSYYKTAAPPVIDLGETALTEAEQAFLRDFYLQGLGEFAYRNSLDLSGLRLEAPRAPARSPVQRPAARRPPRPGPVRRRDRLDRHGRAGTAPRGRGAVRGEPARRPLRRHRGARRGHRARSRPRRTRDRPPAPPLRRARLPQRPRAGDRHLVRDRRAGRGARGPGRGGDVQRVVGVRPDPGVPGPPGQPPVLQERGIRGRPPRRARRQSRTAPGVLLLAQGPHRAVGGQGVRRVRPVPRHVPQLQQGFLYRTGEAIHLLVR